MASLVNESNNQRRVLSSDMGRSIPNEDHSFFPHSNTNQENHNNDSEVEASVDLKNQSYIPQK